MIVFEVEESEVETTAGTEGVKAGASTIRFTGVVADVLTAVMAMASTVVRVVLLSADVMSPMARHVSGVGADIVALLETVVELLRQSQ